MTTYTLEEVRAALDVARDWGWQFGSREGGYSADHVATLDMVRSSRWFEFRELAEGGFVAERRTSTSDVVSLNDLMKEVSAFGALMRQASRRTISTKTLQRLEQ